jgi:hypothetical protein
MATGRKPGGTKTGGRKKGTPNKLTRDVKEAIISAFATVGGEKYLVKVAGENPAVFCQLLSKVLPTQVTGADGGALKVSFIVEG